MLELRLNNTSRMSREAHVRFCERLRGETPLCLLGASYVATLKLNAWVHGVQSIVHVIVLMAMDYRLWAMDHDY